MSRRTLLLETCEDRILCSATPQVTLSAPSNSKIGDDVTVKATFSNATGSNAGYGPYVDLVIDKTGADGNDGVTFNGATYLGQAVTATVLTFDAQGHATHPYAKDSAGNAVVVNAPPGYSAGDQLVVLQLPFGSFTPQQPAASIDISLKMSNLADVGTPIPISARGGFQYGNDALNNPATDPSIIQGTFSNAALNPTLFTLKKSYLGPEDETATGPNYLRQYQIDVDIAAGQTISNLQLSDLLPDNLQFYSDATHPVEVLVNGSAAASTATATPGSTSPGGTLTRTLASVTGDTTSAADATLRFWFYVPRLDAASSPIVVVNTGDDVISQNNASTGGTWSPIDTRDPQTTVTLDPAGPEHTITAKSIATQKTVATVVDNGVAGLSPGDVLEYTIQVQVSDYFAFQNLVLTDLLSDGQHLDQSFTPTLITTEHGGGVTLSGFDNANWTAAQNYTGAVANGPVYTLDPAANDGTTSITFRLSDEMITRGANADLVGGGIPNGGTGAGALPNNPPLPFGATTATIKFRVIVQDTYSDKTSDPQLSPRDVITNDVTVSGDLLKVNDLTPNGNSEADTSSTSLAVAQPVLTKTVYAINGVLVTGNAVQIIRPGDLITYRLRYTVPTGDIDDFSLTDFLPLPVFDVNDFDLTYVNSAPSTTAPPANTVTRGPTDTFTSITGLTPTITEPGGNAVQFAYGSFSNTTNTTLTSDLLLTVVVNSEPFADGLFLTNQARATEGIARTGVVDTDAVVQFNLGEPDVELYKGVVGTNGAGSTLGGITFNGAGTPNFTGTIDDTSEVTAIDAADGAGVDAGDVVRFAVVARNIGRADAYDVSISDQIIPAYAIPASLAGLNLAVRRGDGTLLTQGTDYTVAYNNATGQFSVTLTDNYNRGAGTGGLNFGKTDANGTANTDGSNVLVIMYDLTLKNNVSVGAVETNTATLTNFSNKEGGIDFTTTDPTATADVLVDKAALTKQTITTGIMDPRGNGQFQAVIGETVTSTLTITVPEGTISPAILSDLLDPGLAFVAVDSIVSSSGVTYTGTPLSPSVSNGGRTVNYDFGTITNSSSSNGTPETITITYRAVVLDVQSNQAGTALGSIGASLAYRAIDQPTGTSNPLFALAPPPAQRVTVVEPTINTTISTTVNGVGGSNPPGDAGDPVVYTIVLSHPAGSADAFDVDFSDLVPAEVVVTGFTVVDSAGLITAGSFVRSGNSLTTVAGGFDFANTPGRTLTIRISGNYANSVPAGTTVTNSATTKWTSVDGTPGAQSSYDPSSVERTGADGTLSSGTLNNYQTITPVTTTTDISAVKSIVSTSEAHTTGANVTPGEIVRYRLVTRLGEGNTADVRLLDNMPAGFTFLNDGTARIAFVSNGAGFTSTTLSGAGLNQTGNETSVSSIVPTFVLPDAAISSASGSNTDTYANGTPVYLKLGDLSVNDRDTDGEFVVVEFNAIVSNAAGSSNNAVSVGGSDAGDTNSNNFTVIRDTTTAVATSNNVDTTVVEPKVTIAKAITQTPTDAGDTVKYTITLTNTNSATTSTAYDLAVRDLLDNDLTLVSVTDSLGRGSLGTSVVSGQTQLDYAIDHLDANETVVITVTGTVKSTASAGEVVSNNAVVTYTSLPGSGTADGSGGNTTGSTAGTAGAATGERTGSGTAPNDYTATSATVNFTIAAPTIDKLDLTSTNEKVGDQVVYFINVTLPEGVTENLTLSDLLPNGLTPLSYDIILNGAASGTTSTPTANFSGTGLTAGHTDIAAGADGQDIVLNLGNITTTADNNAANNNFLIRVVAQVSDSAAATNGAVLANVGQLSYRVPTVSASTDPGTGSLATISDTSNVTVVEPKLQVVKSVSDTAPELGQTVTYTLVISHAAGSTATAYDLDLRDVIPAGMTLVAGSVTSSVTGTDNSAGALVDYIYDQLAVGSTITITFQAKVSTSPAYIGQAIDNNVKVYWDSQASDDANAVLTGSADGTPDRDYGPTAGYTEAATPSPDDPAQDTQRLTVNAHTVSGTVYNDVDRSGGFNAGDLTLNNVTVTLTGTDLNGNAVSLTTTTSGAGAYSFVVAAGNYVLTETTPAGYVDGVETVGTNYSGTRSNALGSETITNITIASHGAATGTGYNFGETQTSSLAGRVYSDANNNGAFNAGETLLAGITVTLTGTDSYSQAVSLTTTTDASGNYSFTGLRPGTYTLTETQPAGYFDGKETAGTGPTTVGTVNNTVDNNTISAIGLRGGQAGINYLFGEVLPASVAGTVYNDANNNNVVDAGETLLAGVTVKLTGTDDRGASVNLTTATDGSGNYAFANLRPGNYILTETQPGGYLDGKNAVGSSGGSTVNAPPSDVISAIPLASGATATGYNFGELRSSSLSGYVFRDDNNDGVKNGADAAIAGVTITVTGTDDNGASVNLTTTTAADGTYTFANLRPGTYAVTETQPAGYLDGTDTAGTAGGTLGNDTVTGIVLTENVAANGYVFGEIQPSSIAGRVYVDANNNGVLDAGETRISGASLTLTGSDDRGSVSTTVTSDASGNYTFANLRPGTYTITETQPSGYLDGKNTVGTGTGSTTNVPPSDIISGIVVATNTDVSQYDFGELRAAAVTGTVFRDYNNDGTKQAGEPGISGVSITLTGTDDLGNAVNKTVTSNAAGAYTFFNLRPGTYTVSEAQPAGYLDGKDTLGNAGGTLTNDQAAGLTLVEGQTGSGYNFGELAPSSMTGHAYLDANNDGVLQAGETLLQNVAINLTGTDDLGNAVSLSTTTNASGLYSFTNLRPGTYQIAETQPAGYFDGRDAAGTSGGTPAAVPGDTISAISLASNTAATDYNFGELAPSSLSGVVYSDADNDGGLDAGEARLANVTITLTGTNDLGQTVNLITTTAGDGTYSFAALRPGTYTVTETQPASYLDGKNTVGTSGGNTSNNPPSDAIDTITLPSNTAATAYNFGELAPSSLSGHVYLDLNQNGVRNAGESGVPNVTIQLTGTDDLGQAVSQTQTTAGDGSYNFTNLRPSTSGYTITETQPANYADGADQVGTQGGTAGNDALTTAPLVAGTNGTGNDFGERFVNDLGKGIVSTSEPGTSGSAVAIGEVVRYRVTATVPYGTLRDYQLQELLPAGLAFLDDGTAAVSLVSADGASLSSSGVVGAGATSVGTPSALLTDAAVSSSATANADAYASGTHVFFKLGTLTDTDTDASSAETVVIEFNARVVDVAANQSGTALSNQFAVRFDSTGDGVADDQPQAGNPPPVVVNVVEPKLSLVKTADDSTPDLGRTVNYTLTITHTAQSTEDAFDLVLNDAMPPGMTLDVSSLQVNGAAIDTNGSTTSGVVLKLDALALNGTITITYSATVDNTLANVGGTLANNARLYWDSLPGDEASNQVLDGGTDGTPDRDYGATPGYLEAGTPVVDDPAQDTEAVTVNTNTLSGTVYRDNDGSGTLSAGDTPLAGVSVKLEGTSTTGLAVSLVTTTLADGSYTFDRLPAGTYTLTETQPNGYIDGLETAGVASSFGGNVSNALGSDVITQITIPVQTTSAEGNYNFGETLAASLSGHVYLDDDNDGVRDAGEAGLGSVPITLTGTDIYGQGVTLNGTTDASGTFTFANLRPGTYTVTEDDSALVPGTYLDGRDTPGPLGGALGGAAPKADVIGSIVLPQGTAAADYNFGELRPATLSGSVYIDANHDGLRGNGEAGIGGVQVTLTGTNDLGQAVNRQISTLADGTFAFANLRPGTYALTETQPAQYADGPDAAGTLGGAPANDTITNIGVQAGQSGASYTFGEQLNGIAGQVYVDRNRDGNAGAGEPGLGGVALALRDSANQVVATTTSNPDGTFTFSDLLAGDYTVVETQPAGYGSSTPDAVLVTVPTGGVGRASFGETLSTLGGTVYVDADQSGALSGGDTRLGGVTVTLTGTDANGQSVTRTTSTAADGTYQFDDLLSGQYALTETQPAGYSDGPETIGTGGGVLVPNDSITQITVGAGTVVTGYQFGEVANVTPARGGISGVVFYDRNINGTIDGGEPGIAGVKLTLRDQVGNVVGTATTGTDGSYAFTNLAPGSYSITETQPAAYGSSTGNQLGVTVVANSIASGRNFGETSGSLAGTVYFDSNNDGASEAGEKGIAGVTVTLTGTDYNGAAVSRTAVTDANGDYRFTEVLGGTYAVTETQPANIADGLDALGTAGGTLGNDNVINIGLGGGVNATGYLFGEQAAAIRGTVYVDADRDTVRGGAEQGLAGVTLSLVDGANNVIGTTQTAADGSFVFMGVAPGAYRVVETQPGGYGNSTANVVPITVPATGISGVDFGETVGSLSGRVYLDADQSGTYSAGEGGIGGVVVTLMGTDANNQAVSLSTTTAGDGTYLFDGLLAGNYTLTESQPGAYQDGADSLGSIGGTNSANDQFSGIGLGAGVQANSYNFGETLPTVPGKGSITGTVFVDRNRNQALDGSETGVVGVTLTLLDSSNGVVATTTTNPDGSFVFTNIDPGAGYQIVETQPNGYSSSTLDTIGGVTVTDSQVTGSQNFGETLGSLSGRVYLDRDLSNSDTAGDTGIGGVTVTLTGQDVNGGNVSRTTTTAADGSYTFDDLLAGTYTLSETQPAAYLDGAETPGTLNGGTTVNDSIDTIPLSPGDQGTGYAFGEKGAQIGGQVYRDNNQGGTRDSGEPGLGGVALQLRDAQGNVVATVTTQPDGGYLFSNLPLGNYTIVETQPPAYGSSTPNQMPVAVTGSTPAVDFGETPGQISGTVYHDLNNNGVLDAGEPLLSGVTIQLTGTDVTGAPISLVTTTDNFGQYNFAGLPAGTYTLTETQPAGYKDGTNTPGSAGGNTALNNVISGIGLGAGHTERGYLFGERTDVDLVVTKDDGLSSVKPGQHVTYTVTISNAGLQEANGVIVSDHFPSDVLEFVSASNGGVYDPTTRTITWQLGQVTGSNQEVITLSVEARVRSVIPAGKERLSNLVSVVDDGSAGVDLNPRNNEAKDIDVITAAPDLYVHKTDNLTEVAVGRQTTYVITGGNSGHQVAGGVIVTDTLPPGVRFVSATNGGTLKGNQVVWNLGDLAPGQSFTLTVSVVVEVPAAATTLSNSVSITDRLGSFEDPTPGDNSAIDLTAVLALPIPGLPFAYDSFHNFSTEPFFRGFEGWPLAPLGQEGYHNPTDNYRPAVLPLAPIYSGEADPGSTLVIMVYNANGDVIGEQTVMVDAGGNWMATFANSEVRDYPASVSIVELPAPYAEANTAGHNLRNYFAPVLNPGQFSFGGQDTTPLDPRAEAPLLSTLNLANPLELENVKYGAELLPAAGGPGGR